MPVERTKRLFDVDDYHRMAQAGILSADDRVELIDGEVVTMTPIGPRHNASIDRATRAAVAAVGDRAIVRVQGSIRLSRVVEPQPDLVLLRPQADFYASRLPQTLLAEREIPVHYGIEEFREDLQTIDRLGEG